MPTTETFANCTTCCQSNPVCCISGFTNLTAQWAGLTITLTKQGDGSFLGFLGSATGTGTYGQCQGSFTLTCSAGRYYVVIGITIPLPGQTCSVPCIALRFDAAGVLATSCDPFLLTGRIYCTSSGSDTGLDATITE
jgi:hypothetical protein